MVTKPELEQLFQFKTAQRPNLPTQPKADQQSASVSTDGSFTRVKNIREISYDRLDYLFDKKCSKLQSVSEKAANSKFLAKVAMSEGWAEKKENDMN